MIDENVVSDVWVLFKQYLDKKHLEESAEAYIDLLADYGVEDMTFKSALGHDKDLDKAVHYYLDLDEPEDDWDA